MPERTRPTHRNPRHPAKFHEHPQEPQEAAAYRAPPLRPRCHPEAFWEPPQEPFLEDSGPRAPERTPTEDPDAQKQPGSDLKSGGLFLTASAAGLPDVVSKPSGARRHFRENRRCTHGTGSRSPTHPAPTASPQGPASGPRTPRRRPRRPGLRPRAAQARSIRREPHSAPRCDPALVGADAPLSCSPDRTHEVDARQRVRRSKRVTTRTGEELTRPVTGPTAV